MGNGRRCQSVSMHDLNAVCINRKILLWGMTISRTISNFVANVGSQNIVGGGSVRLVESGNNNKKLASIYKRQEKK